jgi:acetyl-CoA C-acetyltransferase
MVVDTCSPHDRNPPDLVAGPHPRTNTTREGLISMYEAVICEPLRTPIGRMGGSLKSLTAAQLGTTVLKGLLEATKIDPAAIGDVVLGHSYCTSEEPSIGRVVALDAGLPVTVPGMQVDRRCGSGLQAILFAALEVQAGVNDVVVAGGTESMSNVIHYITGIRGGDRPGTNVVMQDALTRGRATAGGRLHPVPGGMLETAENLRREYSIPREEQDRLALTSHQRAVHAQKSGIFAEEIVPVAVQTRQGPVTVDTDEHPRSDASLDALSKLRAVMSRDDAEATVTAGNSSGQNDGAALCIVTHPRRAAELGLRPLVRLVSWAVAGVPPKTMGIGPVPASAAALEKAGLKMSDMDLIELNEAFAAQVLACTREWGFGEADQERLNVNGSGISLGHPIGATGARILTTMTREMHRRGARYGLEAMCIGGGQGLAAVFERVTP